MLKFAGMKNRRFIFIFILSACLFSCKGSEDNVNIPSGIIPPDSLVGIFVDFHLAEAALMDKQQYHKIPEDYAVYYYTYIMKKHNIDRNSFDKSMRFYSYHPKLLREVYEDVISELSTNQGRSMQQIPRYN